MEFPWYLSELLCVRLRYRAISKKLHTYMSYNITIYICPDEYSSFFALFYTVRPETLRLIVVIISKVGVIRDDFEQGLVWTYRISLVHAWDSSNEMDPCLCSFGMLPRTSDWTVPCMKLRGLFLLSANNRRE
jgi:hypothetical protein